MCYYSEEGLGVWWKPCPEKSVCMFSFGPKGGVMKSGHICEKHVDAFRKQIEDQGWVIEKIVRYT